MAALPFLGNEGGPEMGDVGASTILAANASRPELPVRRRPLYWENIAFLVFTHLGGTGTVLYVVRAHFSWVTLALALAWFVLSMVATTGGYHRLFAHRAYRCHGALRLFYLMFGAGSFQGPALRWASDHRTHHARTDEDDDPHNIRKGFWWAHVGWLSYRAPPSDYRNVKDLLADPLVRFQDRFYLPLGLAIGFLAPSLIAWTWGDAAGGLLVAGILRLLIQYHATFAINSVAHWIGRRPYSTETSARDSWIAALLTMGEGYHNFHHRFPGDYRNGFRWHHFDPTKWWIWLLSIIGVAWELKRVPREAVRKAQEMRRAEEMT
jgi:stearoyl-CoA desaturase (delta-9 desaturase)